MGRSMTLAEAIAEQRREQGLKAANTLKKPSILVEEIGFDTEEDCIVQASPHTPVPPTNIELPNGSSSQSPKINYNEATETIESKGSSHIPSFSNNVESSRGSYQAANDSNLLTTSAVIETTDTQISPKKKIKERDAGSESNMTSMKVKKYDTEIFTKSSFKCPDSKIQNLPQKSRKHERDEPIRPKDAKVTKMKNTSQTQSKQVTHSQVKEGVIKTEKKSRAKISQQQIPGGDLKFRGNAKANNHKKKKMGVDESSASENTRKTKVAQNPKLGESK